MKVRARVASLKDAPDEVIEVGWSRDAELNVEVGTEYVVHGISFWGIPQYGRPRITWVLVFSEHLRTTSWLPAWIFEVTDGNLDPDWKCNFFPSGAVAIGPPFVSESEEAYEALAEHDEEAMRRFWARQIRLENEAKEEEG